MILLSEKRNRVRAFQQRKEKRMKERLKRMDPARRKIELKAMKKEHGAKIVDKVTLDQLLGGARSIKCILWETSPAATEIETEWSTGCVARSDYRTGSRE